MEDFNSTLTWQLTERISAAVSVSPSDITVNATAASVSLTITIAASSSWHSAWIASTLQPMLVNSTIASRFLALEVISAVTLQTIIDVSTPVAPPLPPFTPMDNADGDLALSSESVSEATSAVLLAVTMTTGVFLLIVLMLLGHMCARRIQRRPVQADTKVVPTSYGSKESSPTVTRCGSEQTDEGDSSGDTRACSSNNSKSSTPTGPGEQKLDGFEMDLYRNSDTQTGSGEPSGSTDSGSDDDLNPDSRPSPTATMLTQARLNRIRQNSLSNSNIDTCPAPMRVVTQAGVGSATLDSGSDDELNPDFLPSPRNPDGSVGFNTPKRASYDDSLGADTSYSHGVYPVNLEASSPTCNNRRDVDSCSPNSDHELGSDRWGRVRARLPETLAEARLNRIRKARSHMDSLPVASPMTMPDAGALGASDLDPLTNSVYAMTLGITTPSSRLGGALGAPRAPVGALPGIPAPGGRWRRAFEGVLAAGADAGDASVTLSTSDRLHRARVDRERRQSATGIKEDAAYVRARAATSRLNANDRLQRVRDDRERRRSATGIEEHPSIVRARACSYRNAQKKAATETIQVQQLWINRHVHKSCSPSQMELQFEWLEETVRCSETEEDGEMKI